MNKSNVEVYESESGDVRFYIAYSDNKISSGILVMKPYASLPKHNRPLAIENDTQISGKCLMTLFYDNREESVELGAGEGIQMDRGQWHIHANPFDDVSVTLWKAEGDITEILSVIRKSYRKI